jgi:hypothetical protein
MTPGFTAESSLSCRLDAYAGSAHHSSDSNRSVRPADTNPPPTSLQPITNFADCFASCITSGGSPAECGELCATWFPDTAYPKVPPPPVEPPPPLLPGAAGMIAAGLSALIIGGLVVANVKYHYTMGEETGCTGIPMGTCPSGGKGYPCATPGGLCYYNGFWGSTLGKCTTVPTAAHGERAYGACKCECQ